MVLQEDEMRRVLTLGAGLLCLVGLTAVAQARAVEYMSKHPLPRKVGHGFCYIDVPHFHDFAPSDPRLYRQVDGQYYFVGDPAPFEYEGPRYAYYGAHPVVEANVQFGQPVYCYLRGPHYHWYQPPPQASFELKGGAYWYVGTYPQAYYDERPRYVAVNEAYAPIVYTRPIVDVTVAPPAFRGEIVAGGPGWRGQAVVGAPVVSAGVYVAPPPPVQVGIGVNIGGPPTVVERREIYEVREHHDNGRHRGWYKHGHEGGGWRGGPPPPQAGGWKGSPAPAPARGGGWKGGPAPAPAAGGWKGGGGGGGKKHDGWKR
jgi:hypothetical protein